MHASTSYREFVFLRTYDVEHSRSIVRINNENVGYVLSQSKYVAGYFATLCHMTIASFSFNN